MGSVYGLCRAGYSEFVSKARALCWCKSATTVGGYPNDSTPAFYGNLNCQDICVRLTKQTQMPASLQKLSSRAPEDDDDDESVLKSNELHQY